MASEKPGVINPSSILGFVFAGIFLIICLILLIRNKAVLRSMSCALSCCTFVKVVNNNNNNGDIELGDIIVEESRTRTVPHMRRVGSGSSPVDPGQSEDTQGSQSPERLSNGEDTDPTEIPLPSTPFLATVPPSPAQVALPPSPNQVSLPPSPASSALSSTPVQAALPLPSGPAVSPPPPGIVFTRFLQNSTNLRERRLRARHETAEQLRLAAEALRNSTETLPLYESAVLPGYNVADGDELPPDYLEDFPDGRY
jgi:hypothetical protein